MHNSKTIGSTETKQNKITVNKTHFAFVILGTNSAIKNNQKSTIKSFSLESYMDCQS